MEDGQLNISQVFLEPHSSNEVESTLREYANAVKTLVRPSLSSQVAASHHSPVGRCVRQEDGRSTLRSGWR